MRVLILRPEPQASRMAASLAELGHEAVVAPMLAIRPIEGAADAVRRVAPSVEGVLLTSPQALGAVGADAAELGLAGVPLYAVGDATAADARARGFRQVTSVAGDVDALIAHVADLSPSPSVLLHIAGRDRAGDLSAALAIRGLHVETVESYAADPASHLPADVLSDLHAGRFDAVVAASRRTVDAFLDCLSLDGRAAWIGEQRFVVMSEAVAAPLRAAGARHVIIPPVPDGTALLASLVAAR
jgi:uroporphyrinogen-III synthase